MSAFRRRLGRRLLAATLALAAAQAAHAAEVSLRLSIDSALPRSIWVEPLQADGRAAGEPVMLEAEAGSGGAVQARYVGTLAPGAWRLFAVTADLFDDELAALVPAVETPREGLSAPGAEIVSLIADGAVFDVPAGVPVLDLGSAAMIGRGNVGVLDRRSGDEGWRVPVADFAAHPLLARFRSDVRWLSAPLPYGEEGWWILASGGRVAVGGGDAGWRVHRVLQDAMATRLTPVEDAGVVAIGEFGEIEFLDAEGARQALVSPVPPLEYLLNIRCDAALRCVAAVGPGGRGNGRREGRLLLSTDARVGGWREVARVEHRWRVGLLVEGGEVLAVGDGDELHRIPLDGVAPVTQGELARSAGGAIVRLRDGRLTTGSQVSSDGGRTWQALRATLPDQRLPVDDAGVMYDRRGPYGMKGRPDAALTELLPEAVQSLNRAIVAHAVAARGPGQVMVVEDELLVSRDRGETWAVDADLATALRGDAPPPLPRASRSPRPAASAAADAGRVAVLMDDRLAELTLVFHWDRVPPMFGDILLVPTGADQATALSPLRDRLGGRFARAIDAAIADALARRGQVLVGPVRERRASEAMLPRLRFQGEIDQRVLLKPASMLPREAPTPIGLSRDFRRLRVAMAVSRFEGRSPPFRRTGPQEVVVVIEAPETITAGAALEAWGREDGAPVRAAVQDAIQATLDYALDGVPAGLDGQVPGRIDVLTSSGVDRVEGTLLAIGERDLLVALRDGALLRIEGRLLAEALADAEATTAPDGPATPAAGR